MRNASIYVRSFVAPEVLLTIFGIVVTLTSDLLTSKSNQFTLVHSRAAFKL